MNTQVDPSEGPSSACPQGRRMPVPRTPGTDGWEEMGTTSFPAPLHLRWAVPPVQLCKDKLKTLNKSITYI